MASAERYAFIVEYFDPHSSMNWRYQFFHYFTTNEIEMVSAGVSATAMAGFSQGGRARVWHGCVANPSRGQGDGG